MEIVKLKAKQLESNTGQVEGLPANPREWTKETIDNIAKSLQETPELFEARPCLVYPHNDKYIILGGNLRFEGAKKCKIKDIPCIVFPADTSVDKLKEIVIKDNGSFGAWDMDMLANEWDDLPLTDWGVNCSWDAEQGQETEQGESAQAEEDDFDVDAEVETRCKKGDVWKLGEHRLMCGDSTSAEDVEKLMGGEKADMVFTDPPYGMNLDTDFSGMGKGKSFNGKKGGNKYDAGIVDSFDSKMLNTIFSLNVAETFIWGADYFAELIPNKNEGSWIVWDKRANNNGDEEQDNSSDKMFGSCFELCWSKAKHKRDIARVKWAGLFGISEEFDHKRCHPTQKPIKLCSWFLTRYSNQQELIIDLFGGSGSTLIACEQLNRKARLMELDEHYCDVILTRWETLTGKKAEKIE